VGVVTTRPSEAEPAAPKDASAADRVELFNLADDPNEKTNLAARHVEKVRELRARYDAFARQALPPKAAPKAAGFRSPRVWGEAD
jgi:arylsulfatase A-like enzyme